MVPELESCDAILQWWYGGEQGGTALAEVLFGQYNPSGKLPVTFYRNTDELPDFLDYTMAGRTYRYFQGQPLFPFGFGLSYTTFSVSKPVYKNDKLQVKVSNTVASKSKQYRKPPGTGNRTGLYPPCSRHRGATQVTASLPASTAGSRRDKNHQHSTAPQQF